MPISFSINSTGFDSNLTVKKNVFGFGEVGIIGNSAKLKFSDKQAGLSKIILKIIEVLSFVFPSLTQTRFVASTYIDSHGQTKSYFASISRNQLNRFIELSCKDRFAPLGGSSPEVINKIKEQLVGKNSYCKAAGTPSLKQFFILLSNEIGKEASKEYKHALKMQESLRKGERPEVLLLQSIQAGFPSSAEWLLRNGASPSVLQMMIPQTKQEEEMIDWLKKIIHAPLSVHPDTLDEAALGRGFGYKTANQMVLKAQAKSLNAKLKNCAVKIASFLPLSDYQMRHYLEKNFPDFFTSSE